MMENDTQNSRQAASTAFHNAPKLAKIAQAGIQGGPAGAAAEATVQYRKEVLVVVIAVLLLPVLVLIMLPGAIFGTLTQPSTAVNNDLEVAANVIQLRNAVSDLLQEAYEDAGGVVLLPEHARAVQILLVGNYCTVQNHLLQSLLYFLGADALFRDGNGRVEQQKRFLY